MKQREKTHHPASLRVFPRQRVAARQQSVLLSGSAQDFENATS
jgi:hypothetical protein